jgi:coenzyme F420 hydrogenase subunit beta
MPKSKAGFEETLAKNVVAAHKCVGCAACVVVCPFGCLQYVDGQPVLLQPCECCGICPAACPECAWSWTKAEEFVFGRRRREDEEFGIYRRLVLGQATDERVRAKAQDGGAVTSLLLHALQSGMIDGAAISGVAGDKPLCPVPTLATTPDEILEGAGTRYAYSPNLLAYAEGVTQGKKSLAFVGTPCQIHAVRRLQMQRLRKYSDPLCFTVGLMCTESFTYEGLYAQHFQRLGLDLADVVKVNIKGKVIVDLRSGEQRHVSLAEAKQFARRSCSWCSDFSAELADISAGGLGLSRWTFLVVRTERGVQVVDGAVEAGIIKIRKVAEEPAAQALLVKLSRRKWQNSLRS